MLIKWNVRTGVSKMIDFQNKALFPTSLEISLHPIYSALVRPYLEYGLPTCSPHLKADINHLEEIQKLAQKGW